MSNRRRRPDFYFLLSAAVLSALTVAIVLARPFAGRPAKPRTNLDLKVADQNGRMRIDWDAASPAIQNAQGATLEVEDGGVFNRYPVEPKILRSGGLDYVRRSEDVFLTLTLYQDGRPGLQSSVRRISPVEGEVAATATQPGRNDTRARKR